MDGGDMTAEVRRLQRILNDLLAVVSLPAIWTDLEPRQIANTLIEALVQLLALDFAYIRLTDADEDTLTESVRSSGRGDLQPQDVVPALAPCLAEDAPHDVLTLPNPVGEGFTSAVVYRLGLQDEVGRLIVGAGRPDFPTPMERLLVRVAANEAAIGLQEARHLARQRKAAEELERSLAGERTARLEAQKATILRDEVLAVLAHDLRNPMTAILGAAQLMTMTTEDAQQKHELGMICRATRTMEALVSDLLDIARIEAGTPVLNTRPVDVGVLIREGVNLFEPQALLRRINMVVTVEEGLPEIPADENRLLQVLSNLLGNAMKFSGDETTINARGTRADGWVRISIEDSGIGIPAEHLEHVFERFWQAERGSRAGAGLGLAICKAIVEAHGGRIWATSTEGRGTTMHFEIPEGGGATDSRESDGPADVTRAPGQS
jgi:signal transduction histidine kinase